MKLTIGAKKLEAWVKDGRTQVELADLLSARLGRKIHQSTVSSYACGKYIPGTDVAVALERETGIPVEDWIEAFADDLAPTGTDS